MTTKDIKFEYCIVLTDEERKDRDKMMNRIHLSLIQAFY